MVFTFEPIKNWYCASTLDIAAIIASGAISDPYFTQYDNLDKIIVKLVSTEGKQHIVVGFPVVEGYNGSEPLSDSSFVHKQAHDTFVLDSILLIDAQEDEYIVYANQLSMAADFNITFTSIASTPNTPAGSNVSRAVIQAGTYTQVTVNEYGQVVAGFNPDGIDTAPLETAIINEQSARMAADTSLAASIASEISNRQVAEANINTDLNNEIDARVTADSSLNTAIAAEISARFDAIATETSLREAADDSLSDAIAQAIIEQQAAANTEIAARDAAIATETSLREMADDNLSDAIAAEANTRFAETHSLSTAILSEANSRFNADTSLQNNINNEASIRASNDIAVLSDAKAYTDSKVANISSSGSLTQNYSVKDLTVSGDIMPSIPGVSKIGSPDYKFAAVYTKEMHIDANTLYVDGVPVLGSSANTIHFTADPNQGMNISTSGFGPLTMNSEYMTTLSATGANADVVVQATGANGLARISSSTQVTLTAPTVATVGNQTVSGNLTVSGDMTIAGTATTVNSSNLTIKDNVITVNKGQLDDGVSLDTAGMEVDRGGLARQRLVWKESVGKWVMGEGSSLHSLASEEYVTSAISGKADVSSLAAVATSGSYADLSNKPNIPTVPTTLSSFTNDSGFTTISALSDETTRAQAAETSLNNAISTEANSRAAADTSLAASIAVEISNRESADSSLSSRITRLESNTTSPALKQYIWTNFGGF